MSRVGAGKRPTDTITGGGKGNGKGRVRVTVRAREGIVERVYDVQGMEKGIERRARVRVAREGDKEGEVKQENNRIGLGKEGLRPRKTLDAVEA